MLLQKIYVVPIRTKCGKEKFSGTAAHLSYLFSFNWILQRNGISKIIPGTKRNRLWKEENKTILALGGGTKTKYLS